MFQVRLLRGMQFRLPGSAYVVSFDRTSAGMGILIIYISAQQHGTRAPVSVVAGQAILIACRNDVLLH